ncbi:hypothetical protein JNK13_07905 [bacterium]|nr:hypothetical protein [bacterium]
MQFSLRLFAGVLAVAALAFTAGLIWARINTPLCIEQVLEDPRQLKSSAAEDAKPDHDSDRSGSAVQANQADLTGDHVELKEKFNQDLAAGANTDFALRRLKILQKFITVDAKQEVELLEVFRGKSNKQLADIVGEDQAKFYREQVEQSFKKSEYEGIEKEQFYFTRKLALAPQQEEALRSILFSTAAANAELFASADHQKLSMQEKVKLFLAQERNLSSARDSQFKKILSKEQYLRYLELKSNSASSDLELFHDSADVSTQMKANNEGIK